MSEELAGRNREDAAAQSGAILDDISVIFLTWKRRLQRDMLAYGLNMKQFYVLRQLSKRGPLHPSEIARFLFCDRPTATVILANLSKRGWISVAPDPGNRKLRLAELTSSGVEKLAAIPRKLYDLGAMDFDPCGPLTPSERERLAVLLRMMKRHFDGFR